VVSAPTQASITPREAWRVAHVTATYPPYVGGTGIVAHHNVAVLNRRGHDAHIITTAEAPIGWVDSPDVPVHRQRARFRLGNAPLAPGLGRDLASYDLVHLHYPFYFGGEQVWAACRRNRQPYVVTYHQDVLFRGPLSMVARVHHALFGARILEDARAVAATSLDYARSSLLTGLSRALVVELPNGVDVERFRIDLHGHHLRRRYELAEGSPVILFVGGLDRAHYFKGVSVLLQAAQALPQASVLIVGEGDLREAYERQAHQAGLAARVRFAGRVSDQELPLHYALADVTVLPSITRGEAFGLVLVESMATATPVVASSLPGVRTVVDDGETGFLVAPGDPHDLAAKLRTLLADQGLRARMGAAGRRKVEQRYDWSRIGVQLEGLYASATGPTSRHRAAVAGRGLA
jgi:glycosyltransferase involved in cell wall biosynthesis